MYLEVGEDVLVVLVGVWAGRAAVRVAQRGMAGSLCFPSAPGASSWLEGAQGPVREPC